MVRQLRIVFTIGLIQCLANMMETRQENRHELLFECFFFKSTSLFVLWTHICQFLY